MNNDLFQQARAAYAAKDYAGALQAFTQCLQDGSHPLAPGEMGLLYHQIGNCLVKLKDCNEAIHAYTQATADAAYDACGAVNYNLGMAYAALHDYEAGVAFREAALDEGNPDPTKALLNLGVCFMALDRPADAVASYESALQFGMQPDTKNKLYANLGQAYVACGQMQKAVNAFEQSIADKTYYLSDSASVDYQRAIAAVAQGTSEITQVMPAVASAGDLSGLDVAADGAPMYADEGAYAYGQQDPYYYADAYGEQAYSGTEAGDHFFNASDEELEKWSKGLAKQDRKRRNVGLKVLVAIVLLVVVALGAAVFLYTQGWGYPTQETVVKELFANPEAASSTVFAKEVDADKAKTMVEPLVADANPAIDGVDKSMSDSTVYVTAKTEQGGDVQYKVSLVRDMIGWKVSSVELYFPSQN